MCFCSGLNTSRVAANKISKILTTSWHWRLAGQEARLARCVDFTNTHNLIWSYHMMKLLHKFRDNQWLLKVEGLQEPFLGFLERPSSIADIAHVLKSVFGWCAYYVETTGNIRRKIASRYLKKSKSVINPWINLSCVTTHAVSKLTNSGCIIHLLHVAPSRSVA